jgi:ketosteroid isomerase-like protein
MKVVQGIFDCFHAFLSDGHGSIEWDGSGTDVGVYNTGKRFSVRGVSVIEVRDGKISRSVDYYDLATTVRQEELIP